MGVSAGGDFCRTLCFQRAPARVKKKKNNMDPFAGGGSNPLFGGGSFSTNPLAKKPPSQNQLGGASYNPFYQDRGGSFENPLFADSRKAPPKAEPPAVAKKV